MKRNRDSFCGCRASAPLAKSSQVAGGAPALQFGRRKFCSE
jgi:hypothetical protein